MGRPVGLDGFLGLYVEPEDLVHFQPECIVYIENDPYTVREVRRGNKGPEVVFAEVGDRDTAERLRGNDVFVARRRELLEGEFWPDDLRGLAVRPGGGEVVDVVHGAAQDRLVVRRGDVSFEVPFVDDLVPVVDLAGGFIEIVEIEGLSSPSGQS